MFSSTRGVWPYLQNKQLLYVCVFYMHIGSKHVWNTSGAGRKTAGT